MKKITILLFSALIALSLGGCASPYARKGFSGGYDDKQLGPTTWKVTFHGNTDTSKEIVFNYWLYRCAELTLQQGFQVFVVKKDDKLGLDVQSDSGEWSAAGYDGSGPPRWQKTRAVSVAPVFWFSPAQRYYTANGLVQMYWEPVPEDLSGGLKAHVIRDMLKPFIDSAGKTTPPAVGELIKAARVLPERRV